MSKLFLSATAIIIGLESGIGNGQLLKNTIANLKAERKKLELAVKRNDEYIRSYMKLELLYWQSGTSKQREENKEELEQANKIKANNYIKL